ncbi:MAG: hypothetical protein ChlgKO_04260 [Chlamydiales bacterium]
MSFIEKTNKNIDLAQLSVSHTPMGMMQDVKMPNFIGGNQTESGKTLGKRTTSMTELGPPNTTKKTTKVALSGGERSSATPEKLKPDMTSRIRVFGMLRDAFAQDKIEEIEKFFEKDPDFIWTNEDDQTVLHYAAKFSKNKKILEYVIDNYPYIDSVDNKGKTALNHAAFRGNSTAVELLLSKNADPNTPDNEGNTPLLSAVDGNKIDVVKQLLNYDVDPNTANKKGRTAIEVSIIWFHLDILQHLVDSLTDPEEKNRTLASTLDLAFTYGGDVPQNGKHIGEEGGLIEVVNFLIDQGVDVNKPIGSNKITPLQFAKNYDYRDLADILINKGAEHTPSPKNAYMS